MLALRSALLTAVLLGATLAGCAGVQLSEDEAAADNGPSFLIHGRLSARRPGHEVLLVTFDWARGYLADGWSDRISVTDSSGVQLARIVTTADGVEVATPGRPKYRHPSFEKMMEREVGILVEPRKLAGWLVNEHDGGELPNKLIDGDIGVEILDRDSSGLPARMRLIHANGSVLLLAVTERF